MTAALLAFRDTTSTTARESFYRGSERQVSSAGSEKAQARFYRAKLQSSNAGRLSAAMDAALAEARPDMDQAAADMAYRAIKEALDVIGSVGFSRMPWVGISDDGIAMLRWERGGQGIALSFSGEGIFGLSKKTGPDDHYNTGYKELAAEEGLSESDIKDIVRLS